MAKARARTTARKVKDKWRAKQWYSIVAPASFNRITIAETPSDDPKKLVGRVATTTMQDLTGDFKAMHVKLHFQVQEVNGNRAQTMFAGHSYTSDFVRRLVRRNHTKVTVIQDVQTKDGAMVRVKPILVTDHRSQSSQATLLRQTVEQTLVNTAKEASLGQFVKVMLDGTLTNQIFKACRPIHPLRKAEIYKSELRQAPTIVLEDLEEESIIGGPSETEAAQEETDGGDVEAEDPQATEAGEESEGEEPPAASEDSEESEAEPSNTEDEDDEKAPTPPLESEDEESASDEESDEETVEVTPSEKA